VVVPLFWFEKMSVGITVVDLRRWGGWTRRRRSEKMRVCGTHCCRYEKMGWKSS